MNTKSILLCFVAATAATQLVSAKPINNPPIAGGDVIKCVPSGAVHMLVSGAKSVLSNDLDPDGDAISAAILFLPQHGTLTLQPDGTFTYHNADITSKTDEFTYAACDPSNACSLGTVNIVIGF